MNPLHLFFAAAVLSAAASPALAQVYDKNGVRLDAALSIRQGYDSNVMLQSQGPLANIGSPVTTVTPTIALSVENPLGFSGVLKLDYALAATYYCDPSSETNYNQALGLKFAGKQDRWSYDFSNAVINIGDNSDSFFAYSPDGAPALGAPSIRDRRDQTLYRGVNKLQYTADNWLLRGVLNGYYVNYGITQKAVQYYQNFADRGDVNAGVDAGWKVYTDTFLVLGYRYGYQYQGHVLNNPLQAGNTYQRILFGAEGNVAKTLKYNFLFGPDFRDYQAQASPQIPDTTIYFEGAFTWNPTKEDEVVFTGKVWTLPASGGKTVYQDSCFDLAWKHNWSKKLSSTLGFRAARGDWAQPVTRDDWVYTPRLQFEYQINKHFSVEAGVQGDFGRSAIPDLEGRDYDRSYCWVGLKMKI